MAFCARRVGVALSCLISCYVSASVSGFPETRSDLLQSLVVHKACCVLWDVQLPLLEMFSKLPVGDIGVRLRVESQNLTQNHKKKTIAVTRTTEEL